MRRSIVLPADIRTALGGTRASTLIVEARFAFTAGITFNAAARSTLDAAQRRHVSAAAQATRTAFTARGLR
ncbi:hypothetical protein [Dactylosporangium sp. CA-233914]|uniref:hypothetical protein n=1 Tax=Dactylosporangium sp. CA-233914 TaxID=3239934 RepID=UPI003D947A29